MVVVDLAEVVFGAFEDCPELPQAAAAIDNSESPVRLILFSENFLVTLESDLFEWLSMTSEISG